MFPRFYRVFPARALIASLVALAASPAFAQSLHASNIRMNPEGVEDPMIEVSAGTEVSSSDQAVVQVLLGFEYRGIRGKEEGQYWARVYAQGGIDPTTADVTSFRVEFTPYHRVGESNPLPAAWDTRFFNIVAARDTTLNREYDATIKVLGATAGIYLPATDPGDLEASIVIAAEALGGKIRKYAEDQLATFYGGYIGGLSAEATVGTKLNDNFTVTGQFGGGGEWSAGASQGFSVVTDANVYLNLTVSYRTWFKFIVGGEYDYTRDSGSDFDQGVFRFLATLRFSF